MKKIYLNLSVLLCLASGGLYAQQGTLDSTFNGNGIVILTPSASHDNGYAVAVQPDSNIVIAGMTTITPATGYDICVARLHHDGSIDSTFGTNGYVIYDYMGKTDYCTDVDLQPDGKIVVCGAVSVTAANTDFFAMRLNTDGSYDTTFGSGGMVIIPFTGGEDYIKKGLIQPDGKILLVGYNIVSSYDHATLVRLNSDGTPDTTFGSTLTGIAQSNFGNLELRIEEIIMRSTGKYVAVGYSTNLAGAHVGQAFGFTSNGLEDSTFGVNGIRALTGTITGRGIAERNNTLYICGSSGTIGIIYALNDTGNYIPTFGTGGKTNVALGSNVSYNSIALQQDGKIIAGGGEFAASSDFLISRFNANGKPDTTFGNSGHANYDLGLGTSENMQSVIIQPDGKLLGCGTSLQTTNNDIAIIRVDASSSSMGVQDNSAMTSVINVFPNPANDHITINIPYLEDISNVQLVSITGRATQLYRNGINNYTLPQLSKGLYILKVATRKQVFYHKLMIN